VFGTYSADKPSAMVKQLRPSLDRIAQRTSDILGEEVEIRLQVVREYEDGVSLIVSGKVDFARLGPASYVVAKQRNPELDILAVESKDGANTFNGVICVRNDSPVTQIGQLKGKSFAFGSSDSTLGRYFSQLALMRAGVYARDLMRYEYLGRHDMVGRAVGSGLFDAGALEETTFANMVAGGVPIRALLTFSNATRPWVARSGLQPRIRDALRQALLHLNDPAALQALRFDGFVEGSDANYEPTRKAMEENPRFFAER
jgi:phosphonate transport system substrate-binding protein